MKTYCVRQKKKTGCVSGSEGVKIASNGRQMLVCICSECGATKTQFMSGQTGGALRNDFACGRDLQGKRPGTEKECFKQGRIGYWGLNPIDDVLMEHLIIESKEDRNRRARERRRAKKQAGVQPAKLIVTLDDDGNPIAMKSEEMTKTTRKKPTLVKRKKPPVMMVMTLDDDGNPITMRADEMTKIKRKKPTLVDSLESKLTENKDLLARYLPKPETKRKKPRGDVRVLDNNIVIKNPDGSYVVIPEEGYASDIDDVFKGVSKEEAKELIKKFKAKEPVTRFKTRPKPVRKPPPKSPMKYNPFRKPVKKSPLKYNPFIPYHKPSPGAVTKDDMTLIRKATSARRRLGSF